MSFTKAKLFILSLITLTVALLFIGFFTFSDNTDEDCILTLYGNVDIRQVNLSFRVFGKITHLYVDEGDSIEPGKLLAKLDPMPYQHAAEVAKGKLEQIKAELANAEKLFDRRKGLTSLGSISEENYTSTFYNQMALKASLKQAQATYNQSLLDLEDTKLLALQKGVILSRVREPGSIVQPGEPVFVVSITSPVWVRAYVSEPNLGLIYPGMKAKVYTDTPENPIYEGHIGFISPVAEFTPKSVETTQLRTDLVYRLRIIIDNPDEGLRQGMPVTIELLHDEDDGNCD